MAITTTTQAACPLLYFFLTCTMSACGMAAEAQPRVVCPAIQQDDRKRTNAPMEAARPVELVVIGPCKRVGEENPGGAEQFEIEVQKVLYGGATAGKTVRFQWWWDVHADMPEIFALAPTAYEDQALWEFRYSLPSQEETSQRALAAARLDYHALSAESIFIGQEIAANDDYEHTVQVQRVLAGASPNAGVTVIAEIDGYGRQSGGSPRVSAVAQIYFVDRTFIDQDTKQLKYHVRCRQAVAQEHAVTEALKRRDDYTVVETTDDDEPGKAREIVFRGTTAEAIGLLASESHGAVTLAERTLLCNQTALDPVFTAAEQGIFVQAEVTPGEFRRLRNLISVLHDMAKNAGRNRVAELLEQHLAYLAGTPPEPPPLPGKSYWGREEEACNRALTWLLRDVGDGERLKFGQRLLKLRDSASAGWKARIQDALDESNIENSLALVVQVERSRNIQPLRSPPGFFQDGPYVVAFSPDGNLLATVGMVTRVWDTQTWAKLSEFKSGGSVACFSPDSKHLYIAGGGPPGLGRYDWRSGKEDRAFVGHHPSIAELALSADASIMTTSNFYEKKLHIWNTSTGATLRSIDLTEVYCHLALSPDGKTLLYETGERQWRAESVLNGVRLADGLKTNHAAFSADGRHLVFIQGSDRYEQNPMCRVEVREPKAPFALINTRELSTNLAVVNGRDSLLSLSPDGRRLAVSLPRRREASVHSDLDVSVTVLSLPELKPICSMEIPSLGGDLLLDGVAFSPDGKVLALAKGYSPPLLFDASTGERIVPSPDHQAGISDLYISADNKTLSSVAKDTICTWDMQTLKQRTRVALPANRVAISGRPDGRYVLCRETTADKKITVIESGTGHVACEMELYIDPHNPEVFWIGDQEVLCFTNEGYRHFDYLTGKVAKEGKLKDCRGVHPLAATGEWLLPDFNIKAGLLVFSTLDLATDKRTEHPEMRLPSFTGNERLLVPGDKYYCLANPGFHLCEWRTQTLVASRPLNGVRVLGLSFSADGAHYAMFAEGSASTDLALRQFDRQIPRTVRVYETLSGKMVCAFPATTRSIRALTFSPDSKRLALVNEDSTLEVWPVVTEPEK